jgi:hypothetical protein
LAGVDAAVAELALAEAVLGEQLRFACLTLASTLYSPSFPPQASAILEDNQLQAISSASACLEETIWIRSRSLKVSIRFFSSGL